jgi:hypothetical protein
MKYIFILIAGFLLVILSSSIIQAQGIRTTDELLKAVNEGTSGDTVLIAPGTYVLNEPLKPKQGMKIKGHGSNRTILTANSTWQPDLSKLPDEENPDAYLFSFTNTNNVVISDMQLTGPTLAGALYAYDSDGLELSGLLVKDFRWSSIRTFAMDNMKVHDNTFIDAGGVFEWVGGALYLNWTSNSEFWNNKILKSPNFDRELFGFKGREGKNLRFHHNDVQVGFSLEFPFEKDQEIEIDHNRFVGPISIPKADGGPVYKDGLSYHIHHNWLQSSYAIEYPRNSIEIDHNFFDFDVKKDGGNLISSFARDTTPGGTSFHDNYIQNPGRGVFWAEGIYNQFYFYNNYIKSAGTTRQDGFFSFKDGSNLQSLVIKDNIIENTDKNPRPLLRTASSRNAVVENNTLVNISDTSSYANSDTGADRGPSEPLRFDVGVNGEYVIDGWDTRRHHS